MCWPPASGPPVSPNNRGRHCTHHRCRADGYLYPALFHAEEAQSHYCLRAVGRKNPFCPRALSGGAGHWAGNCKDFVRKHSDHGGADVVLEVAGTEDTFRLAWECARPNAIVTIVALYDQPQLLPLPEMYGKNLVFKTGGVDGCDCAEILRLIAAGQIDTTPLITHRFPLEEIDEAYRILRIGWRG